MRPRLAGFFAFIVAISALSMPFAGYCDEESENGESPSGASFKTDKGVMVIDETKKILGLEITDVVEEKLPQVIRFDVQVFGEKHLVAHEEINHSGCEIHASGMLPYKKAALLEAKQPVKMYVPSKEALDGFIVAVKKEVALGEAEIIVGVTSQGAQLKDGEFLKAVVTLTREDSVAVIPRSALLETAQGKFVYVVNGEAYLRTAVKTGSESEGKIEITDGLFAGDQVVTKPVETLWLIELRATKGGGHCH